jgi:hypothetical protein
LRTTSPGRAEVVFLDKVRECTGYGCSVFPVKVEYSNSFKIRILMIIVSRKLEFQRENRTVDLVQRHPSPKCDY